MSLDARHDDLAQCRRTERRTLAASGVLHALLFFLLLRSGAPVASEGGLTEVSLLEPGDGFEPSAPAPAAPAAPRTQAGVLRPHDTEVRFRRPAQAGETAPDPQSDAALEDRLNERLATLQSSTSSPVLGLATVAPRLPQLATASGLPGGLGTGSGGPLALRRGGGEGGGGGALELVRGGGGRGGVPDLALAQLPTEKPASRPAPPPREVAARNSLAGVSLAGPIADRPVLAAVKPEYPEWAKADAVEGSVRLYFVVLPDGRVKENVLVQKTAGFEDFDDNAVAALRSWRFAPLGAGRTGDQWGTITFRFRIVDAR